jgi:soluble lytic murein transglycosylase-like protein
VTGISEVMSRISQIQSMASGVGAGFGMTLHGAVSASTDAATTTESSADPTYEARSNSVDIIGEPTPLPGGAGRWQAAVERAASANGIDPKLLTALVWVESGFDPNAVSSAGAIGLAQLMPDTAEGLGVDPYDPEQNLEGGARFLAAMIDRFGRTDLALAAYNAGPAKVASLHDGGPGVPVAEGYVSAVLDRYEQLGGTQ